MSFLMTCSTDTQEIQKRFQKMEDSPKESKFKHLYC